jgi:undecaprenyl-phosphate galactose phosphotransferase
MGYQHYGSDMLQMSGSRVDWRRLHAAAMDRALIDRSRLAALKEPAKRIRKRAMDVTGAALLLTILSPLLLTIALLVLRDGGQMLFGHRRIGAQGRQFRCWKFRTMVPNAEAVLRDLLRRDPEAKREWEKDFKLRNDPRITPIGRFLRSTSLDELPQLINVLMGEMSLVGPRPIVNDEIARYGAAFHDYTRCRPGITGVWQVSGRNDTGYRRRVHLDQHYARHYSFGGDIAILLRTPVAVLRRSGAY